MSGDLKTQVRDYTEFFMGTVESIDLQEIKERPIRLAEGPVRPLASPSRHRGWLVAVAGAVVVLVFGGLTFLTRQTAPEAPAASQLSPSPTMTTPAPVPSVPIEGSAAGWSRVPHNEAVFGGEGLPGMSSVIVGGPGLVAVGRDDGDAMVLTSVDGVTWSRVPHDEAVFGGTGMWDVTAGGPGLVAVGDDALQNEDWEDGDAAVWTSVDGVTWSRVPHDEDVFGAAFMRSVTAGGPGLVAVGGTEKIRTDGDAVVWTSVDGVTWSRVAHDETIFGGPKHQTMFDVVVGGPGLVAVGKEGDKHAWDNSLDNAAAVWTSVDGFTWSRVPHDETVFGTGGNPRTPTSPGPVMLSVTAGGPGLVAVGRKAAWTSPDGVTWSRIADDVTARSFMTGVTAGGPGLVAVGLGSSGAAAVLTSVDGITWSQAPDDDAVFGSYPDWIYDVTVGGPGLVAVGNAGGHPAVWVWVAATED